MNGWVRWQKRAAPRLVSRSPHIDRNGTISRIDDVAGVVRVRHVVGFTREDWGEGNWTAKDLR